MKERYNVLRQAGLLALLTAAGVAVMWLIYGLLGRLDQRVLLGGVIGWALASGNFLSLSVAVSNAVDRAARGGDPVKAQLEIQMSSVLRPLLLAVFYFILLRTGVCDILAAGIPLLIAQTVIKFLGFFRKDGGGTA